MLVAGSALSRGVAWRGVISGGVQVVRKKLTLARRAVGGGLLHRAAIRGLLVDSLGLA